MSDVSGKEEVNPFQRSIAGDSSFSSPVAADSSVELASIEASFSSPEAAILRLDGPSSLQQVAGRIIPFGGPPSSELERESELGDDSTSGVACSGRVSAASSGEPSGETFTIE